MAKRKRYTPAQITAMAGKARKLTEEGYTQAEMAKALKISLATLVRRVLPEADEAPVAAPKRKTAAPKPAGMSISVPPPCTISVAKDGTVTVTAG